MALRIAKLWWAAVAAIVLAICLACAASPAFAYYRGFSDVPGDHWAVTEGWIDKAVDGKWMTGYADGRFGPEDSVTRGQIATILYRLSYPNRNDTRSSQAYAANATPFRDNASYQYYTAAINWAYAEGIMTGDSSTGFTTVRPDAGISRQELATMAQRYASARIGRSTTAAGTAVAKAPDYSRIPSWASAGVAWCYDRGVMTGFKPSGELRGWDGATRAQACKMISQLMSGIAWENSKVLDRSKWQSRMPLPTEGQISSSNFATRSPYLVVWPNFNGTTGFGEYSVDFRADSQPRGEYLCTAYFAMSQDGLKNRYANVEGGGAYCGFQVLADGSKVALFSVWDIDCTSADGTKTTIHAKRTYPQDGETRSFGNEGNGVQTFVDYDWRTGRTYRVLLQCGMTPGGNCELQFWVCDLESGEWTELIAYDLGYGDTYMQGVGCFLENWHTDYSGEVRTMELGNFRVNSREKGRWVSATSATMERQFTEWTGSYNFGTDNRWFWAVATGVPGLCSPPANGTYYVGTAETGQPY